MCCFILLLAPSGALVFIMVYYVHTHPLFQILQILKCFKDPTCAIFLKGMGFNYIKYDIPVYSRMSIIIIISYHQKYKVLCIFLHFSALLCTSLHLSAFLMQFFAFLCIFLYISAFLMVAQSAVAQ